MSDRRFDCRHYDKCLGEAARANDSSLPCEGCGRYRRALLDTEDVFRLIILSMVIIEYPGHEELFLRTRDKGYT